MKLKHQVALSVVLITTLGLLAAFAVTYVLHSRYLESAAIERLQALSAVQTERLSDTIRAQYDRVSLITSRTRLRSLFNEYLKGQTGSDKAKEGMSRILRDGMQAVKGFKQIVVYDHKQQLFLAVNHPDYPHVLSARAIDLDTRMTMNHHIARDRLGAIEVQIHAPLMLGNEHLGHLVARVDGESFLGIFSNYQGFGATGEPVLTRRTPQGDYLVLHNLRFDPLAALTRVFKGQHDETPVAAAFETESKVLVDATDYRGKQVLAVANPLPQLGWGLLIKQDRDEVYAVMSRHLWVYAVVLLVIVLILSGISFYVSGRLTQPLRALQSLAERVRSGERSHRMNVKGDNEIAVFARVFDGMLDELQTFNERLERQVEERTRELEESRAEADEASQAKSKFLAAMSHEVRTPMNAVLGMSEMLQNTKLSAQQRDMLSTIRESGRALLEQINEILDFSKIESEQLAIENVPFDLYRTVYEAVRVNAPAAQLKDIDLVVDFEECLPHHYIGDPTRIKQILINLIGNALKFTEKGHVLVKVEASDLYVSGESKRLRISVEDTGIGISGEVLPKLFDLFTQADDSTTRKYGGTGLGLAIAKRLAELMDGSLDASSEPGRGSCFTFSRIFPISDEQHVEDVTGNDGLAHKRLLLVDDTPVNHYVFSQNLAPLNLEIETADSAEDALEVYAQAVAEDEPFDFVITDFMMGGMNGSELVVKLKQAYPEARTRYIMLSGSIAQVDYDLLEKEGFHAFLAKPVEAFVLRRAVRFVENKPGTFWTYSRLTKSPDEEQLGRQFGHHVLVVEDIASNRLVAKAMLENFGLRVTMAEHGRQAFEQVQRQQFDLILMDIRMPVVDGYQATKLIRGYETEHDQPRTPIVALTADVTKETMDQVTSVGMDGMLTKPIELKELEEALNSYLALSGIEQG
ncbi:MAG: response regulator [Oleiphilaceae bacterium]|nr:response regulator [Oleiphilaceae bacterium]